MAGPSKSSVSTPASSAAPFLGSAPPPRLTGSETVLKPGRAQDPDPAQAQSQTSNSDLQKVLFPTDVGSGDQLPLIDVSELHIAHYRIQQRIGSGGMGAVFKALDTRLQRIVALKVLSPAYARDTGAVQRFQNEARATALLDHDNVAGVYFFGESQGVHFIAYEYVQGRNIRDMIRQRGRIEIAEAVNYSLQLTAALQHMAAAGVVHRDIKPSNVIVTPKGRAKLVDLGLARKQNEDSLGDLTVAGTTLGTFDYISPEQAKDPRKVDVRSDIYSLGCTLYHMITGEPPYPEGTVLQKLLDHQGKEPPDPARRNRRVPDNLSAVVRRMMASDPRRRYNSAEALSRDLMMVATSLGMRGTTSEGLVWTASRSQGPGFVARNLGWMSTAALLLLIVGLIQKFPEYSKDVAEDPSLRNAAPSSQRDTDSSTNAPTLAARNPSAAPVGQVVGELPIEYTPSQPDQQRLYVPDVVAPSELLRDSRLGLLFERITPLIIPGRIPSASGSSSGRMVVPNSAAVDGMTDNGTAVAIGDPDAGPDASGPSTSGTAAAVPPSSAPIVLYSADGDRELAFATLEAACAAADDGSVIELRYSGRHSSGRAEKPLQITDKKVTIRARNGFRPLIEFRQTDTVDRAEAHMITLTGGSIELVDVDLMMASDATSATARPVLFMLDQAREVFLSGVTIRIQNDSAYSATVFELAGGMDGKPSGTATERQMSELSISIRNCVLAGAADMFVVADSSGGLIEISDSALALFGCLVRQFENPDLPESLDGIDLRLDHCTVVSAGVVDVRTGQMPNQVVPLAVTSTECVFASIDGVSALVHIEGEGATDELLAAVPVWSADTNIYDQLPGFLTAIEMGSESQPVPMDFAEWSEMIDLSDRSSEFGSEERRVRWSSNWTGRSVDEWSSDAFRFDGFEPDPDSTLPDLINPTEVGADVSRLPQLTPVTPTNSSDR